MKRRAGMTVLLLTLAAWAGAETPRTINYQGRLMDRANQPVTDSQYQVTFRIYTDEQQGDMIWEESQKVVTRDGYFNTILGNITPLDLDQYAQPLWLEIKAGEENILSPRQPLGAYPYTASMSNMSISTEQIADWAMDTMKIMSNAVSSVSSIKGSLDGFLPVKNEWAVFPGMSRDIETGDSFLMFFLNIGGYGDAGGSGLAYQIWIDDQTADANPIYFNSRYNTEDFHKYASYIWVTPNTVSKGVHKIQLKYKGGPLAAKIKFDGWDPQKLLILELKR